MTVYDNQVNIVIWYQTLCKSVDKSDDTDDDVDAAVNAAPEAEAGDHDECSW